jgi:integrase
MVEIEEYEKYMLSLGKRKQTIKIYAFWLTKIPSEILGSLDPKKFNEWVYTQGLTVNNIHMICFAFKSYLGFKQREDLVNLVKTPKMSYSGSIYYLKEEEIQRLFENARSLRSKAMLRLLFETGVRASVIVGLKVSDFDFKNNKLTVRSAMKGNKGKLKYECFFTDETKDLVQKFITQKKIKYDKKLFNISYVRLYVIIKKMAKKAGLPNWVSPHTLRHSFATHFYQKTRHAKALQELLGHKSSAMDSVYIHLSEQDKKDEFKKAFEGGEKDGKKKED